MNLVSVIIPFYKNSKWLNQALDSVLSQTLLPSEIIIIDDGSDEDITHILRNKKSINIVYYKQSNKGPAAARNKGIELSNSKYIAFLDSDDIWLNNKLEVQINYMEENNSVWSHSSYIKFYENSKKRIVKDVSNFKNTVYPKILSVCPIATPSIVIKREVLVNNTLLRFNENIKFGEDIYLWLELSKLFKLDVISEPLVMVRIRGTNASKLALVQLRFRRYLWNDFVKHKTNIKISIFSVIGYRLSIFANNFLNKLFKKDSKIKELIAKIAYVIPWLLFKIGYRR